MAKVLLVLGLNGTFYLDSSVHFFDLQDTLKTTCSSELCGDRYLQHERLIGPLLGGLQNETVASVDLCYLYYKIPGSLEVT